MKFAVFLMLLLCLSSVSAAPYDTGHSVDEKFRAEADAASGDQPITEESPAERGDSPAGSDDQVGSDSANTEAVDDGVNQIPGGSRKKKAIDDQESEQSQAPGAPAPEGSGPELAAPGDDIPIGGESAGGGPEGADDAKPPQVDDTELPGVNGGEDSNPEVTTLPTLSEAEDSDEGDGASTDLSEDPAAEGAEGEGKAPHPRPIEDESSEEPDTSASRPQGLGSYFRRAPERIAALRNALRAPGAALRQRPRGSGNPGSAPPQGPVDFEGAALPDGPEGAPPGVIPPDSIRGHPQRGSGAGDPLDEAGDPQLKWTDPNDPGLNGGVSCLEGTNCNDGMDQGVVNAMPAQNPIETPVGCRSLDSCIFITQNKKIFGPYEMTGLSQHFHNKARMVDMLLGGRKIRGFLMGPLRTLGRPFRRFFSPGSRKK